MATAAIVGGWSVQIGVRVHNAIVYVRHGSGAEAAWSYP